jgi:hypothetical protein
MTAEDGHVDDQLFVCEGFEGGKLSTARECSGWCALSKDKQSRLGLTIFDEQEAFATSGENRLTPSD